MGHNDGRFTKPDFRFNLRDRTVTCPGGTAPIPPPTATMRWHWTADWAYPMQHDVEMELLPHLTIPHAKTPVTFTSHLSDWDDAVSFGYPQLRWPTVIVVLLVFYGAAAWAIVGQLIRRKQWHIRHAAGQAESASTSRLGAKTGSIPLYTTSIRSAGTP